MNNKKYIVGIAVESNNSHPEHVSVGHAILFGAIVSQNVNKHFGYNDLYDWKGGIKSKTLWSYSFYPAMDIHSRGTFLYNNKTDIKRIERIVMNSDQVKYDFDEFVSVECSSLEFINNFIGTSSTKPLIEVSSKDYQYDLLQENCIKFALTEFKRITGLSFKHSTDFFGSTLYLPGTILESLREYNHQLDFEGRDKALIPHLSEDALNRYIFDEEDKWNAKFNSL